MKKILLSLSLLLLPLLAGAQSAQRWSIATQTNPGSTFMASIPFAKVYVCTYNTNNLCSTSNLQTIYSNTGLTSPITQPITAAANAVYSYYIQPGTQVLEKVCGSYGQCSLYALQIGNTASGGGGGGGNCNPTGSAGFFVYYNGTGCALGYVDFGTTTANTLTLGAPAVNTVFSTPSRMNSSAPNTGVAYNFTGTGQYEFTNTANNSQPGFKVSSSVGTCGTSGPCMAQFNGPIQVVGPAEFDGAISVLSAGGSFQGNVTNTGAFESSSGFYLANTGFANLIQILPPSTINTYSIKMPSSQGSGALTNDGSGNLSFTPNINSTTGIALADNSSTGIVLTESGGGPITFTGSQLNLNGTNVYATGIAPGSGGPYCLQIASTGQISNTGLACGSGGGGGGSVTSVGLSLPGSLFSVSGSPVTATGVLTGAFVTQSANTIFAGPTTGSAATPTFRSLVAADLPLATSSAFGAVRPDNTTITIAGGVITATVAGGVSSVSNSDSSLTITPTTGAVVASLNLGNANIFTANQTAPAFVTSGATQGVDVLGVGTGTISTTNWPSAYSGWVASNTGTAAYLSQMPSVAPATQSIYTYAAPTTVNGISQSVETNVAVTSVGDHIPTVVAGGTITLPTGAISSGTCSAGTTNTSIGTIGNIVSTDTIAANFNGDPTGVTGYSANTSGSLFIYVWPTAGGLSSKVCNNTTASITPGAATLNWKAVR